MSAPPPAIPYGRKIPSSEERHERRRKAAQNFGNFVVEPIDDVPAIGKKATKAREHAWRAFGDYSKLMDIGNPDEIWIGLCYDSEAAQAHCRAFLTDYVEYSTTRQPCLGPKEHELVRTVNSTRTVLSLWKALILKADLVVLQKKREDARSSRIVPAFRADGSRVTWKLRWDRGDQGRGSGPVYNISNWICTDLTDKFGLSRFQMFVKQATRAEDVIVLLGGLWGRPQDIPCDPRTRLAFHSLVLLATIGGFRPDTLVNLPYSQVQLVLVRDPNYPQKTRLVATFTIHQNKQRTKHVHTNQTETISFAITFIPGQIICLLSLTVGQALIDEAFLDAFGLGFDLSSLTDALNRPIEDGVNCVELPWKPDMENKPIFPLSYARFWELWNLTVLVVGNRGKLLLYSLRVGAATTLNGALEPAARNYIMSQSTKIHESNYQARYLKENLQEIAFGDEAGENSALFNTLRFVTLKRDENAPLYPTQDELNGFEERGDMRAFRAHYEEVKAMYSSCCVEAKRIAARIFHLRRVLSGLVVQARRIEYFKQVDMRRARGLPTTDLRADASGKPYKKVFFATQLPAALRIAEFLSQRDLREGRMLFYIELLVNYTQYLSGTTDLPTTDLPTTDFPTTDFPTTDFPTTGLSTTGTKGTEEIRCLLCGSPSSHRGNLTKHNLNAHISKGAFDKPFSCPECRRLGREDFIVSGGASAWSNHVERCHGGKAHAPNVPHPAETVLQNTKTPCFLCDGSYMSGSGFSRHFRTTHATSSIFDIPFPCPECRGGNKEDIMIDNLSIWHLHESEVHGRNGNTGVLLLRDRAGSKRKRSSSRDEKRPKKIKEGASDVDDYSG
ncbi:hypothetical protein B0H63DRAFT_221614 [Podospora didyma]|uniref:C2H2-type domain-containing protein n=1 Tax=Podospora didyma TaxID=330526 RepID=A0AAE0KJ52_9PEZI|nr:hypothetical protein B0H63DRAFT_221614 [Podospora didyma]